ncbi:hypothetical protein DFH08DRAFT_1006197 [Mycena albidolilacea]|uniref:Uncharacterized protein n=1 Tax=Mycena albidolilacea TaxID=1033008 RepID=A0AAD6ZZM7_9AGAR|nr:hypothetical protein DFH08DRAFT_1006197 [Mycena albidolilacea]
MPQYNTTIEDYSPIISYSAGWSSGGSADSLADLYSDSSFTLTQTDGETATFSFNGTGFSIFGAKRQNHGLYAVMIDGNAFSPDNGQAPDPGQFQAPLFISPPLNQSLHVVTLTNIGNSFVDIDFITFQSSVGADNERLIVNTVQDNDPAFVYTPPNSWGLNPPNLGTYSGSSGHGTETPGTFMTYTFEVCAELLVHVSRLTGGWGYALWTGRGSPFSVSLDGGRPANHTANKQFYQPKVPLYIASNLGPGEHVLKVSYEPTQPGQILAIDYADVYTAPSLQPPSSNGTTTALPSAAVAGIVIALLFILAILAGLLFFLRRRKHRKNRSSLEAPMIQPSMSNRDIVAPVTYPSASAQPSIRSYPSSTNGSYYPSAAPNITVDTRSQTYVSSATSDSEYSPSNISVGVGRTATSSSRRANPQPFPKGTPLPLPPSANQSLAHASAHVRVACESEGGPWESTGLRASVGNGAAGLSTGH